MEKLLNLLSILIICGTTISSVIAASLNEKQEIKDEVINSRTEDNSGNLTRYKRSGEFDHIPDVSKHLRELISNYVIEINRERRGWNLTSKDLIIELDIRVEVIHDIIAKGVRESEPELVVTESTIVKNDYDTKKDISSNEISLRTITTTEESTIDNTSDLSGEVEIESIPIIGVQRKIDFQFSRFGKTKSTKIQQISKKLPPQIVTLEPHSSKKVVAELYVSSVTSNNFISFEVHDSSKYSLQYIGYDNDIGFSKYSIKRTYNLKEAAERYVRHYLKEYPTAIYDGLIPCIEFKDDKMFIRYYPLEIHTVKTELYSHIERL